MMEVGETGSLIPPLVSGVVLPPMPAMPQLLPQMPQLKADNITQPLFHENTFQQAVKVPEPESTRQEEDVSDDTAEVDSGSEAVEEPATKRIRLDENLETKVEEITAPVSAPPVVPVMQPPLQ